MSLLVKICGITREEDAALAVSLGADMLGFIFHPKSPRFVSPDFPARLDTGRAARAGVFVKQSVGEIESVMRFGRLDFAQLHGGQDVKFCQSVGPERVIRVFWPESYESLAAFEEDLYRYRDAARYYLFDAGKRGGGHGRSFNFSLLAGVSSPRPFILAGGLNPQNVARAVAVVRPFGVDLNSGVESAPGKKDAGKLRAAFKALKDSGLRRAGLRPCTPAGHAPCTAMRPVLGVA